jgi:hypothetical protein
MVAWNSLKTLLWAAAFVEFCIDSGATPDFEHQNRSWGTESVKGSKKMEDPIQFSIWGNPIAESRKSVENLLAVTRPHESRLNILRMISRAIAEDAPLRFAGPLGWAATQRLRVDPMFRNVRVFQAGYGPDDQDSLGFCEIHAVFYGGCLGCPVCSGMNDP